MTAPNTELAWSPSYRTGTQTFETRLTAREREVLGLTADGLTSKEIADRLRISPRTADVHRAHLMAKLGLRNRAQVVRYALTAGAALIGVVPAHAVTMSPVADEG